MIPCSIGYLIAIKPLTDEYFRSHFPQQTTDLWSSAILPIKVSPSIAPCIIFKCLGRETQFRKLHFGISSPAKPALITPDPLSITIGWFAMTPYVSILPTNVELVGTVTTVNWRNSKTKVIPYASLTPSFNNRYTTYIEHGGRKGKMFLSVSFSKIMKTKFRAV